MNFAQMLETILEATAWKRQDFVAKIRATLLGAFGEYMCRQISLEIKKGDYWSTEVTSILKYVIKLLDSAKTKTQFKNREKALTEALKEALDISGTEVVFAKTKVANYNPSLYKEIKLLYFDPEEEFKNMVKEFLPQYSNLLK